MKGVFALATLALLSGCANLNLYNKAPQPADQWTTWVCDSQAQVVWRFADPARSQVDLRLGGADQVYRLKRQPSGSGTLYSNEQLAFHTKGEQGLVYWVATDDLIGRGCTAPDRQ